MQEPETLLVAPTKPVLRWFSNPEVIRLTLAIERRVGINTGMHTRDLTDEQWTTLDPLIPKPRTRGDGRGNGTLEVSFGTAGMVTLNVPTGIGGGVQVVGVAIQTDGKIIAGISTINSDGSQ